MGKLWTTDSNGCWIDIWDQPNFTGHYRRLWGPADFPYLRIAEEEWGTADKKSCGWPERILSVLRRFEFSRQCFLGVTTQRVEDVGLLGCNDEIDSLRIFDHPRSRMNRGMPHTYCGQRAI